MIRILIILCRFYTTRQWPRIERIESMFNLFEFGRMFLSYGLLFLIAAGLAVGAVFLGIRFRKNKDAKDAMIENAASQKEA